MQGTETIPNLLKKNQILPLDSMIKYSNLRFMHSYFHHDLPLSFEQLWIPNRDHLPNRVLRNANDLRIPPHHYASINILPLVSFPKIWNEESARKYVPSLNSYSNQLKLALLAAIVL
jgi:hypothetical protein